MAMDKQQMEKERELFAAVRQQEAMNSLRQLQLGQSMQEPQAPQQMPDLNGGTQTPTTSIPQTGGNPNPQTGGSPSLLQGFHEQATQTALELLANIKHLSDRQDLNADVQAGAIHTIAQAIAQLIQLQNQQTDIAPQDKLNLEMQKMQAEHQLKASDLQHKHALDTAKLQMEAQKNQQELQIQNQKAEQEQQHSQQTHEQGLAMNADNHQFNQKLQTAKLQLAAQQTQNKPKSGGNSK